jgi:molybdenum cofactor cytidylyltransferase
MASLLVSAIVLAAGSSRRMAGRHKMVLDVGGEPMIRRTVSTVLAIDPAETIVVTGFAVLSVEAALAGLPVRFVHNRAHEEGQPTSVSTGVKALERFCHAVMVIPGDQPLLKPAHLLELIEAFRTAPGECSIIVPFHRGNRGNPILFAAHHVPEVVGGGLNIGCRHLIETNGDKVARIDVASDAYTVDCDTPADYDAVVARLNGHRAWVS